MKTTPSPAPLSSAGCGRRTPTRARRVVLTVGCLALLTGAARAQEQKLEVGVRPTVADKSIMWSKKPKAPGEGGHGRVYGIAKVEEIKSDQRLVKPVNEGALVTIVLNELDANGFREFKPGEKPDILLTVSYGRGGLHNPYVRDTGYAPTGLAPVPVGTAIGEGASASDAPTQTITGAFAQQMIDEKTPGYEQKLQKAGYEKLFIRITAWANPSGPKGKTYMVWKTVMVVDDPDHRDLNAVAAEMLRAGAPFFDKEIKEPEAEIFRPLPNTRVNVGTPEVVEPKSK